MKPFTYATCCVNSTAELLNAMTSSAVRVTYNTFLRHCDYREVFPWYERTSRLGLTLKNDSCVSFFKSHYNGLPCYYIVHSHIEYIWVPRETVPRSNETAKSVPARRVGTGRVVGHHWPTI